ncbi:hypothetical protein HYALB_00006164 [Hymenoscyphus albidus]|uniref:Terpene synthase n=1 Tax=Hymenoscyphus albidus TaxID=595503 RepID=A0A9N9LMR1_9HELO|nr:hypothetical protein HYALB_00006164 [Hymenoscyphus albidus]
MLAKAQSQPACLADITEARFHPDADRLRAELNKYILDNWPFPNEKARQKFVKQDITGCTYHLYPEIPSERAFYAGMMIAMGFLNDDCLDDLSLEEGRAYLDRLPSIVRGQTLPDRSIPREYMFYDTFEGMRATNEKLANQVVEAYIEFWCAQVNSTRLSNLGLKSYLELRRSDVGSNYANSTMAFGLNIDLTPTELSRITEIEKLQAYHLLVVNDYYSFEKELLDSQTKHEEGAKLFNVVAVLANEIDVSYASSKAIIDVMLRKWEEECRVMVKAIENRGECTEAMAKYLRGKELMNLGNVVWSATTRRYVGFEKLL